MDYLVIDDSPTLCINQHTGVAHKIQKEAQEKTLTEKPVLKNILLGLL